MLVCYLIFVIILRYTFNYHQVVCHLTLVKSINISDKK